MACTCRNISSDGTPETASPWVQSVLGDCIYTPMEWFSFSLGMLSICCWIVAQFPQLYRNYKNQTSESLSIVFLINWFSGDLTNLIGCILTNQLPIQKITAVYYITMDVVMLSQFKYYDWKKSRALRANASVNASGNSMQQPLLGDSESSSGAAFVSVKGKRVAPAVAVTLAMVCVVGATFALSSSPSASVSSASTFSAPRRLLSLGMDSFSATAVSSSPPATSSPATSLPATSHPATSSPATSPPATSPPYTSVPSSSFSPPTTTANPNATASADSGSYCDDIDVPDWSSSGGWDIKLGVLIGWVSGVIYLSSRVPQLYLNFKRRSVEGLSPGMFTMAIMGNLTYGTSLLLRPLSMVYFVSKLPWLVGSLCVCFFDLCILLQFFKYRNAKPLPV